jgi:hypothetical protein
VTPEMQKSIEERMKGMFEKTFILNFDKSSIYKEEEKLEGQVRWNEMDVFNDWRWRKLIKNVKENCMLLIRNLWERVLVKDSLVNYQWN